MRGSARGCWGQAKSGAFVLEWGAHWTSANAPVIPTLTKSCRHLHQPVSFSSVGTIYSYFLGLVPRIALLGLREKQLVMHRRRWKLAFLD